MKHNFFRPGAPVLVTNPDGGQYTGTVIRNAEQAGRFGYIVDPGGPTSEPAFVPVTNVDRPPNGDGR